LDNGTEQTAQSCIYSKLAKTAFDQLDAEGRHEFIARQIADLVANVSNALTEIGCPCLSQKLLGIRQGGEDSACPLQPEDTSRPSLLLTVKLAPLTRALADAGYYDYALMCVELAMSMEPTWDLDLAKAYLLLILGDTEEACEIYRRAVKSWGRIPDVEIRRLAQLASNHHEDDIVDIYHQVVRLQGKHSA
jgi:tetratricopeptide (TPR) repeat protein